ncbi:MAG: SDR family oxidoreductase [Anaerolineae bacterium]
MDLGLNNARVLVTAASQGLGAATARQFSREGATVVISSRDLSALQSTASDIVEETGHPVFTVAADVSDPEAVKRLITNAVEMLGGLDVLVINAGGPPAGTFETFDLGVWSQAINLTLLSAVSLVQAALPALKQSQIPAVLAVVSISVKQPVDNLTLSNVIRPAVVGLMKTLSLELGGYGIRFNSLLPGTIHTGRIDQLMAARAARSGSTPEGELAKVSSTIPLGRVGQPAEFANVAVFLCSPAASYVNGVALPVDGGALRATF